MQEPDKEKLRAFEQKMHDEGADGFADGPRPWETWDESGAQAGAGKRVWEGKARRIYRNAPMRRSLGERILSGLAMVALATMVVGIAGVYFTEKQPQTVAWTAVQPTPIPLPENRGSAVQRLPARVTRPAPVIAEIESLPAPAAGSATGMSDTTPGKEPANDTLLLTETGDDSATTALAETPALRPGDNDTDIEIVTAPTALLLRSTGDAYPNSSATVSEMDMDTELAMEIATAPAADSTMTDAEVTPGTPVRESDTRAPVAAGDSVSRRPESVTAAPATNLINRDSTTAPQAAADRAIPETGIETLQTAMPASGDPELATLAAAAAGSAATHSDTADPDAGEAAGVETTADSNTPAQDMDEVITESQLTGDSEKTVVAMAETQPAAAAPSPSVAAAEPTGDWVVNLASYTYESMARKKLAVFQAKGVNGEIEHTTVNGKPLYRIRVTGFDSSRAARDSIPDLQKTLGLKGVWIARR
ncbi:MAG: SPOR domain-containing protein [Gammaproteobacteria bacterium]